MTKYSAAIQALRNRIGALRDPVERRRRHVSYEVAKALDFTVQRGPLEGFRVSRRPRWGLGDLGGMLLGLYEAPVLSRLAALSSSYRAFIDVGAADGYYGIGLVSAGIFDRSYCFELSARSRRNLVNLSKRAGVEDRVSITGIANAENISKSLNNLDQAAGAAVLIDIEGGEYELLTSEVLMVLNKCTIIVEMHDVGIKTAEKELQLKERADAWFDVSQIDASGKDPHSITQLDFLSETDKWLVCSEARSMSQHWLLFEPRRQSSTSI